MKILEENSYYPFGMKHATYSNNDQPNYKYKYNGKEYQEELGLNLTAMDFRQYDNTLGRFNVIDPLAEQDYGITPYHFGYDNPVLFGDPSGLKAMAPESMENNMVPGSVLALLASGMSGSQLTDYLESQMWGSNIWMVGTKGGGGGGSINTNSTLGLVQSLINLLNNSNYESIGWSNGNVYSTNWTQVNSSESSGGPITYDRNREIYSLLQGDQKLTWECTYQNKLSADDFFCATGQNSNNQLWKDYVVQNDGINIKKNPDMIQKLYQSAGYRYNQYNGIMDNQHALPWIYNEMGKGNLVQMVIGYSSGHNVTVTGVHYMDDFSHNLINYMNPIRGGKTYLQGISSNTVRLIYSISWP